MSMLKSLESPSGKKAYLNLSDHGLSPTAAKQLQIASHENRNKLQKTFQGND